MKILITGASGFLGSKVLEMLIKEYGNENIIAFSSRKIENVNTIIHNNYSFDKNIFENNKDIELILHIGAFIPKSSNDANDIIKSNSNIINTQNLLYTNLPNLKKIIFISTIDVYGHDNVITEKTATNPISLYGWSKLYCEKMVEFFAQEKNIACQILRIGHVFGEGEENYQKIIPLTIKKIINNETIKIFGDGKAIRTFIYVNDVAEAILNSIKLDSSHGIINIVGGKEKITIIELAKKLVEIGKKPTEIEYVESNVENRNLLFDNSKLTTTVLNKFTSLDEGLIKEYKYMEALK